MRWIWTGLIVLVLLSPVVWTYGLQDYQKERIETFLDPSKDPRGAGYQQLQAKITVGSGGFYGKGFQQGTQGRNGFLPVADNDFVFSVLAEEYGFLGVLLALGLYLFVILRSLDAARLAKDRVGAFLVVGIISGFAFQVVYNITMSAGLAPVRGYTLPLMSYGGSSLVATLAGFGLIDVDEAVLWRFSGSIFDLIADRLRLVSGVAVHPRGVRANRPEPKPAVEHLVCRDPLELRE
jgi:rod shape determining protein RodA